MPAALQPASIGAAERTALWNVRAAGAPDRDMTAV